jgi:predicted transcriptional regulator
MVHEQLQKARVDRNLSRGELSKLSGVPRECIRQIETGANFTLETLQKLLPPPPEPPNDLPWLRGTARGR